MLLDTDPGAYATLAGLKAGSVPVSSYGCADYDEDSADLRRDLYGSVFGD